MLHGVSAADQVRRQLSRRGLEVLGQVPDGGGGDAAAAAPAAGRAVSGSGSSSSSSSNSSSSSSSAKRCPASSSSSCADCGEGFSLFSRWKYHCHWCRHLFCSDCITEGVGGLGEPMCFECAWRAQHEGVPDHGRQTGRAWEHKLSAAVHKAAAPAMVAKAPEVVAAAAAAGGGGLAARPTMARVATDAMEEDKERRSGSGGGRGSSSAPTHAAAPSPTSAPHPPSASPRPARRLSQEAAAAARDAAYARLERNIAAPVQALRLRRPILPRSSPALGGRQLSEEGKALVYEAASVGGGNSLAGGVIAAAAAGGAPRALPPPAAGGVVGAGEGVVEEAAAAGAALSSMEATLVLKQSRAALAAGAITRTDHAETERSLQRAGLRRSHDRRGSHYSMPDRHQRPARLRESSRGRGCDDDGGGALPWTQTAGRWRRVG